MTISIDHIIRNLREVFDPEISVNIYDLGLIYNIEASEDSVDITHTLTSAFCPFADEIVREIANILWMKIKGKPIPLYYTDDECKHIIYRYWHKV